MRVIFSDFFAVGCQARANCATTNSVSVPMQQIGSLHDGL